MIKELLDNYFESLQRAGFVGEPVRPGPEESVVRQQLRAAGYGDRDDVVEFFSWSDFSPPNIALSLFWETSTPLTVERAVTAGEFNRELYDEFATDLTGEQFDPLELYPGPDHWIPILEMDGSEFVAVDTSDNPQTGGSVWFAYKSASNFKMFDSLTDAIRTATYCVESKLWTVSDNGWGIACNRTSMANPHDLETPPWATP